MELVFSASLLLTIAQFSVPQGEQVGVSLKLHGVPIPNNSLVDIDDLLYTAPNNPCCNATPSNARPDLHDQGLLCVTDLVDCCDSPHTVRGDWYFPDGHRIEAVFQGYGAAFLVNRGPNQAINRRQFYGSVRLFRRYSRPSRRGCFYCELPSMANPNVNQTLYVNIVNFGIMNFKVNISQSDSNMAGEIFSLTCSATLMDSPPSSIVPFATFEWFFGPNGNASLPSAVTPMPTNLNTNNTYTSTLQFSSLSQSLHTGIYTCRLGAGNLVNSTMVTVKAPPISVIVIANLSIPLVVGQTGNTLTCDVTGAERLSPTIDYQWTRNGETVQGGNSQTLTLSPIQLSHVGNYACHVIVSSPLLDNAISASSDNSQNVTMRIRVPDPQSVTITTSSGGTNVIDGSDVTINCTIVLDSAVMESDELSLLVVSAQLSGPNGIIGNSSSLTMSGTSFTYTTVVNSFGRSDSGNYMCAATIRPSSDFLYGIGELSNQTRVTTGVYFSSRGSYFNANSNIVITDIGEGDCGALLCFTDLIECCRDSDTSDGEGALGQWFYPNGSVVGTRSDGQDFYIDRGLNIVRLNRRRNATSTTGLFCCEVPDATAASTTICMNVVVPPSKRASVCTSEAAKGAAIAVGATIFVECLIGAPVIIAMLLLCQKKRKPTEKNIYDIKLTEKEFQDGAKKDVHELSNKMATVPTAVAQGGTGVRDDVYEEPDHNMATTTSTLQGDEVEDDAYEAMDINALQGDNLYVIPDSVATTTTTLQEGGAEGVGEDTYEVPDNIVDTAATIAVQGGGGVRESVYDEPDNPVATTPLVAYAGTT